MQLERPDWLTDRRILVVVVALVLVASPTIAQTATQWSADPNVELEAASGLTVTTGAQTDFQQQNIWVDDNTLALPGGTIEATGTATVTMDSARLDSGWANFSAMDVSTTAVTIRADDKRPVTVEGQTDTFDYRQVSYDADDDGRVDFVYSGASGNTTVTLQGASPETNIAAVDTATGNTLDVELSGADGTVTLELPNSEHAIDIQTRPTPPYVQTASPINNVFVDSRSVTLNATVADPRGEDVTATIYWQDGAGNWQQVTQQTVPSGGQVSASVSATPATNRWNVSLESADGRVGSSPTFRFRTPGTIRVYNASSGTLLDDRQVTATITSTESDYQTTTTTSDGVIDMLGAPNERLRVELTANGYATGVVVDDVGKNTSAVMYPTASSIPGSDATYVQRFAIDDLTGAFPKENTSLEVRTRIDGEWRLVGSDVFGPRNLAEIPLQNATDYRLRVRSNAGDTKSLGLFTADKPALENQTIILTVQELPPKPPEDDLYTWDASIERPENGAPYIDFQFGAREGTTVSDFTLRIYEYQNASNNWTYDFGVVGSVSHRQPLTEEQSRQVWVVQWNATLDSGEEIGDQKVLGSQPIDWPIDARWGGTFIMLLITVVMTLYGGRLASLGCIIALALAAVAMYFQVIDIFWAFWWAALVVAVGGLLRAADRREVPV